jgi:hypothetical protein
VALVTEDKMRQLIEEILIEPIYAGLHELKKDIDSLSKSVDRLHRKMEAMSKGWN